MAEAPLLELRDVTASYGEITAVRSVSLTVSAGESVALIGRNGAGKSTILRLAAGVVQPLSGDVRVKGRSVVGSPPERRVSDGIVLVPEGRGIFPALTVDENLRMGAFWRRPDRSQTATELDEIYSLIGKLADRRRQAAGSLSGGEQQLLAIGRALLSRPQVLLLDEPSLGLSPKMVEALYETLEALKARRMAFVLVEQYVPLALKLCDNVLGLQKGVAVLSGPTATVQPDELTEVYMGGRELRNQSLDALQ
ncbi:MAG TPA: ABC transporter ATP-binding protein [Acidimicrobiia bacterium]|nr:ABC transporter ATP-binding protein [Acidimicrobiia bacterium]